MSSAVDAHARVAQARIHVARRRWPARTKASSLRDDVVDLERLVHDRIPFGAGGGAALAVFRQRQMQRIEQRDDFLARGDMRQARPRAERRLVEVVERGQAAREEFAIDDALGETIDPAERQPLRRVR